VGYVRRSTDRQEQSIPDQQRAIERYCSERGLRLLRWYIDDAISGTSTVGRKAFQSLIEDAQAPRRDFRTIVCYDVKRFGRVDNDEAGYYRHLLRQQGVQVLYASENFSGDGTDDLLRPVKQWQAREESKDLSKVTIRGLVSKSSTGHWMGGAPPYGYDLRYESQAGNFLLRLRYKADGSKVVMNDAGKPLRSLERGESIAVSRKDRCRLVAGDSERVAIVRRIFRMYAVENRGFKAIADSLNRDRVPPARGPAWARHYSGQWAMTTVRAIVLNPAYCGDMAWNRRTDARFHRIEDGQAVVRDDVLGRRLEANARSSWIIVKNAHEPIVSRHAWEEAQRRMAEKPASADQRGINPRTGVPVTGRNSHPIGGWTGPKARFLLSGLCSCAKCSSRYEGYTERGKKNADGSRPKRHYYACGAAIRRGPSVCRLGLVAQEIMEHAITEAVVRHYSNFTGRGGRPRLERAIQGTLGEKDADVRAERARVAARLERVESSIRNLLDNITSTNRALADERLAQLGKERDALKVRQQELERLHMTQSEVKKVAAETSRFLAALAQTLNDCELDQRQAAIRRCVKRVWVDHERQSVTLEILAVPALTWRTDGAVTLALKLGLRPKTTSPRSRTRACCVGAPGFR
jgi:DNA invertase Pin-like site-specific DNA recombinase